MELEAVVNRLHFDFPACFSCLPVLITEQTICPLLKGLVFLDWPSGWLSRKPCTQ